MRFRKSFASLAAAAFIAGVSLVQASPAQAIGVHITPVCGTTGWRYATFKGHNPARAADFNWGAGAADKGKIVVATYAGTIVSKKVYSGHGYGNTILIKGNDGIYTFYAHLARAYGTVGQRVKTGARIGTLGQSGQQPSPHLHYEQRTGTGSGSAVSIRLKGSALKYYGSYNITPSKKTC
ncbi:murein hydrolase activator EnvC family protein [Micromonosporaceae bacterium Da 78-11]